ncbi:hypothetical protein Xen7305DRAFT_00045280 [Xenococcus sp. PCC 7305]|uniref:zinc ribbon domain-containing protein n=1 Tax=Xenococcus sp. PCC 7305 TaxID=102125 RepID=UPI0002AC021E|nr:zinc ribbon domain-containing protein [Xenococcus sp. PCC 7305]ELS04792.1 hypothetical protein Xen7305DRAFT_00045280 [Xenococcus sp. PCC 7305]
MAYTVNLSGNQQLMIVNQGAQTLISLFSGSSGQQQSQSSSITTGKWKSPPKLYQTTSGFVLQINGKQAKQNVLIQATGINAIANPKLNNAVQVNLKKVPDRAASSQEREFKPMPDLKPMQPMQPMRPMKMGNMSMSMNPMSMQMGNMSLNMEETKKSKSTKNFCAQCGEKVKQSDRFCSSCGNKLDN